MNSTFPRAPLLPMHSKRPAFPARPPAACIFCEKCTPETVLNPDDRIDIAVELTLSPMEVRRLRAQNKERTAVPRPRHGGIHQLIKPLDETEA